jgi:hypothetical protein
MAGNEDLQLIPDQSYMTRGVYVAFISEATVSELTARPHGDGAIRLTWKGVGSGSVEYLVYRYNRPITDVQRLAWPRRSAVRARRTNTRLNPGRERTITPCSYACRNRTWTTRINGSELHPRPGLGWRKPDARFDPAAPGRRSPRRRKRRCPRPRRYRDSGRYLKETFFQGQIRPAVQTARVDVRSSNNEAEVAKAVCSSAGRS